MSAGPRVAPGTPKQIGAVNHAIARIAGAAVGGGPPNVFLTLARHRALFRRWLRFAGALMPGGVLARDETELVILRVARNCESEYERRQHERIARAAGVTAAEVERVRGDIGSGGWSPRREAMLRAADELHERRTLSDASWEQLREHLSEVESIELCMLVGHYEMLAMTLNALKVEPDELPDGGPPRGVRLLQRALRRRDGRR